MAQLVHSILSCMDRIKELISLSVPEHSPKAGVPASSQASAAMQLTSTILWNVALSCWVHDCQHFRNNTKNQIPGDSVEFPRC